MNKIIRLSMAGAIAGACIGAVPAARALMSDVSTPIEKTTPAPLADIAQPAAEDDNTGEQIDWLDVNVETPGSLGVEILYKVSTLGDVKALRVTGQLNTADATTLSNLTSIEHLDLSGASLGMIPNQMFYNRTSLKSVILPEDLTYIGEYAFASTSLEKVTVPSGVTYYGPYCFYNCRQLKEVILEAKANPANYMFSGCSALVKAELAEGVVYIGESAFASCSALKEVKLPETLSRIEREAFYYTSSLTDLVLPDNLTAIGRSAFSGCGIKKIEIPAMAVLDTYVFNNCNRLEEVILPVTLTERSSPLFASCYALNRVECPVPVPPAGNYDLFQNVNRGQITLIVPEFAVVNYKLDNYWMGFGSIGGGASYSVLPLKGELSFSNNRRPENSAYFKLEEGAKMTIGGTAAFKMLGLDVRYNLEEWNPENWKFGQLINSSPSVEPETGCFNLAVPSNRWIFVSFPADIERSKLIHSASGDFVIREYDGEARAANGTGQSWKDVADDALLKAGKGYIVRSNKAGTIRAELNQSQLAQLTANTDRTLSPVAHIADNAANAGWNFLGNPWPSYFDLTMSDLSVPVLIWDANYEKYNAYSMIDDHVVLAPGQGFFIQHAEDGEVTLPGNGRCFTTAGVSQPAKAKGVGEQERELYDLVITGNGDQDRTRIVINPEATADYEIGRDAAKFFSETKPSLELYTLDSEGNPLAINEKDEENRDMALMMKAPVAGTYILSVTRADGRIRILDLETGRQTLLESGDSMEIELPGNGEVTSRYLARLEKDTISGISNTEGVSFSISTGEGFLLTNGVDGPVAVYAADGRLIARGEGDLRIDIPAGIYIVVTSGESQKCLVK